MDLAALATKIVLAMTSLDPSACPDWSGVDPDVVGGIFTHRGCDFPIIMVDGPRGSSDCPADGSLDDPRCASEFDRLVCELDGRPAMAAGGFAATTMSAITLATYTGECVDHRYYRTTATALAGLADRYPSIVIGECRITLVATDDPTVCL